MPIIIKITNSTYRDMPSYLIKWQCPHCSNIKEEHWYVGNTDSFRGNEQHFSFICRDLEYTPRSCGWSTSLIPFSYLELSELSYASHQSSSTR